MQITARVDQRLFDLLCWVGCDPSPSLMQWEVAMIISILNHTNGEIADSKVQEAIRAINRQLQEDFYPYWGIGAQLRLEGRSTTSPAACSTWWTRSRPAG